MKRVLVITPHWPIPFDTFKYGTAIRLRLLLRSFADQGAELHLVLLPDAPQDISAEPLEGLRQRFLADWNLQLASIHVCAPDVPLQQDASSLWQGYLRGALGVDWQRTYASAARPEVTAKLQRVLSATAPDFIFAHRLVSMAALKKLPALAMPVIHDLDDIEHKKYRRMIDEPPHYRAKKLLGLHVPHIKRLERWALRHARLNWVCSEADATELRSAHPGCNVALAQNALPIVAACGLQRSPVVMFVGLLSYLPNKAAVAYLLHRVWPLVRAQRPDAVLKIGGGGEWAIPEAKHPPSGVEFLGFVDDLQSLYESARVVACPIMSGGGTRIKIVEAAIRGRPVVTTAIGLEGLDFRADKEEIVLADSAQQFADEILALLSDDARWERIRAAARARALALYSEDKIKTHIGQQIAAVFAEGGK